MKQKRVYCRTIPAQGFYEAQGKYFPRVSISFPPELLDKMRDLAIKNGTNVNVEVRRILTEFFLTELE